MELLSEYDDEAEKAEAPKVPVLFKALTVVNSASSVVSDSKVNQQFYLDPQTKKVFYNPTADEMWRPLAGPFRPDSDISTAVDQGRVKNAITGYVEDAAIEPFAFEDQFNTFNAQGYALDPTVATESDRAFIGDTGKAESNNGNTVGMGLQIRNKWTKDQKQLRQKRKEMHGDITKTEEYKGPWASYLFEEEVDETKVNELTEEQKTYIAEMANKKAKTRPPEEQLEITSIFHGTEIRDYQGRSFLDSDITAPAEPKNYIPKKWIHTWSGHTKGVTAIRFYPKSGHLLLSGSMDKSVKIWNVNGDRKCMRTYLGHSEAVRDLAFTNDGRHFLSASFDRTIKYWDTETGQCISVHSTKKLPFCIKIHPHESRQHEFLVSQNNKKVVQWDIKSNKVTQVYDEHLGPVNSILFIDNNKKFISTADDKKVFVWEYGIPVVVKHISEPDMQSMPSTALHPSGKFFAGQSQDNRILVYTALNRFKSDKRKQFLGHLGSGYACQIDFSPDGRWIMSGDAQGRVFFWDWKTHKCFKKLKAHDQVAIGAIWHPAESSRVATCSWDGLIKYWD